MASVKLGEFLDYLRSIASFPADRVGNFTQIGLFSDAFEAQLLIDVDPPASICQRSRTFGGIFLNGMSPFFLRTHTVVC